MAVNYEDQRFKNVETEKQTALSEADKTYGDMISQSDGYFQTQIDAVKDYADKQTQLQQEQTDFTIEKIEQEKEQAHKDYLKEQSASYVDYQKQVDPHGVNAEQMAASGMANTGYSESARVSMYNTYQNRVATAKASYDQAVVSYNNAIKDARLQNNSALAEIAYNALQDQLKLSLQGFQYKNELILAREDKKTEINNTYYDRTQDVLQQINTENALEEEKRQFDVSHDFEALEAKYSEEYDALEKKYEGYISPEELEAIKKAENSANVKAFNAGIMTAQEFSRRGGKTTINGKMRAFDNRQQYIDAVLENWYDNGRLTENEVAYLKSQYGLE